MPLYVLKYDEFDRICDVYRKYLAVLPDYEGAVEARLVKEHITNILEEPDIGDFGCALKHLIHLKGNSFYEQAFEALLPLQRDVLGYRFKNPALLLHAVTHRSARSFYQLKGDYEKLEALGDAILDYMININMMRYTMFERYKP